MTQRRINVSCGSLWGGVGNNGPANRLCDQLIDFDHLAHLLATMALTGTHHRTLDNKQRLAVPKQFRDQFGGDSAGELFLAPETEQSLGLYSAQAFEQRAHRLGQRSGGGAELQRFLRLYYSQASGVELDAQGRIRVPERLIEFAGLKEEVVLLGVNDHVELWDRDRWNQFLAQHSPTFDQLAIEAFE